MSNQFTNLQGSQHFISLAQAIEMTSRFRNEKENILAPEYKDKGILPICETFGRDAIDTLLAQTGCVALRVYGGMSANLDVRYIIVGVNALGEDMLPQGESASKILTEPTIVEDGIRCPTTCPPGSPLN
ncbi:MAG: hypothetical protein ABI675_21910 [Chitinophagaceae bacterium]